MFDALPTAQAEYLVDAVLRELNDRAGFDHWWDSIDPDTQVELRQKLVDLLCLS